MRPSRSSAPPSHRTHPGITRIIEGLEKMNLAARIPCPGDRPATLCKITAGGEGFSHNEINPDPTENRMIQLWVLPESQSDTFPSRTVVDVVLINPGDTLSIPGDFIAYITKGNGVANDTTVTGGHILRGHDLHFRAETDALLIVIHIAE
jgi:hypothetical protein